MATVSENALRLIRSHAIDPQQAEQFYQQGLAYFGSDQLFAQWLTSTNAYTMGQTPLSALSAENGVQYLTDLMYRMQDDYGG
ncbi:MAG TPA: hypothetical protein DF774_02695 [Rheinheimera sp.]|uniref:MbcA/ParS/Xre antitoxin family protein n=1 Tax=unclassified Rheinheimera TaxID=115860 RepID=UPI000EC6B3E4|nr:MULTISPECIES: MbcA/ParS/Xre antitoxin family protein [unclassified Rheinheimera]MCT6699822.1 MbcA/ParS/Xre antitoxin family protein [Rheinheimera sp. 4Y26]HCU64650.1 hypothetical protein [Rheinheimera sp.]